MLVTLGLSNLVVGLMVALFLFVCIILILTVLIQRPQGGGLSGAFGSNAGSGQTAFGAKTGDALTIATIGMFVIYIVAATGLNYAVRPPAPGSGTPTATDPAATPATTPDGATPATTAPEGTTPAPEGAAPTAITIPPSTPATGTEPAPAPTGTAPAPAPSEPQPAPAPAAPGSTPPASTPPTSTPPAPTPAPGGGN